MQTAPAVLIPLALLLAAACASTAPGVGSTSRSSADTVTVRVTNNNFYDANVTWVFEGGIERRLGTVRASTTETFTVRWQPAQLAFGVDLIGAGEFISYPINANPGDVIEVHLPSNLDRSLAGSGFRRRR